MSFDDYSNLQSSNGYSHKSSSNYAKKTETENNLPKVVNLNLEGISLFSQEKKPTWLEDLSDQKVNNLAVSLLALADKVKMDPKKLIGSNPDDFMKRFGKVYSTSKQAEEDKELLAKAKLLKARIDEVVLSFKELLAKVIEVKDRMSKFCLTEGQKNLLDDWKNFRKKNYSNDEVDFIIDWLQAIQTQNKTRFNIGETGFLKEGMESDETRKAKVLEKMEVIEYAKNWLNKILGTSYQMGDDPSQEFNKMKNKTSQINIQEMPKEALLKWKDSRAVVLQEQDIQAIINWVNKYCQSFDEKVLYLVWLKEWTTLPYLKCHEKLDELRKDFTFLNVNFQSEINEIHKKFHVLSKDASEAKKELVQLKIKVTERKDMSISYSKEEQIKILNSFAAQNRNPNVVEAQNALHQRTKDFSQILSKMENALAIMEHKIRWDFKYYFSFCAYCSSYGYDPNGFLVETSFGVSYKGGYYKYAEKNELNFNNNGSVIPLELVITPDNKEETV